MVKRQDSDMHISNGTVFITGSVWVFVVFSH